MRRSTVAIRQDADPRERAAHGEAGDPAPRVASGLNFSPHDLLPPLPLERNGPVMAQLSSSDPNLPCYEETFPQANVTKNEVKQFKAKTP